MKSFIKLFAVLIILAGLLFLIKPDLLLGWLQGNLGHSFLYIAAIVIRFFIGIIFILTAKESKFPKVISLLGFLAVFASIVFVFIGSTRFQSFMSTLIDQLAPFAPVTGIFVMITGGFLIYAFSHNTVEQ